MTHLIDTMITEKEQAIERVRKLYEAERRKATSLNVWCMREDLSERMEAAQAKFEELEAKADQAYDELCQLENSPDTTDDEYESACEVYDEQTEETRTAEQIFEAYHDAYELLNKAIDLLDLIEAEEKKG